MTDATAAKRPKLPALQIIRDVLAQESARIRADQEAFVKDGRQKRIESGRLAVILAAGAAADVMTHLIAMGQDARINAAKDAGREPSHTARIKLELALEISRQARAALTLGDEWEGAQEETEGQEGTDAVGASAAE